jgi:hypothetical protein
MRPVGPAPATTTGSFSSVVMGVLPVAVLRYWTEMWFFLTIPPQRA